MNRKYLEHAMQHPMTRRPDVQDRVLNLPVCPRCERVAFRHRSGIKCPMCHYEGKDLGRTVRLHAREV